MSIIILDLRFAIVGTLLKNTTDHITSGLCAYDVRTFGSFLEQQTKRPVINGFRHEQIEKYLENCKWLEYTGYEGKEGCRFYRTDVYMLESRRPWPPNLPRAQRDRVARPLP